MGTGVDVALERAVVDIGAVIVKEWHHGLVLRTVPLDVARLPQPVPVHILVVLVVDRGLASSPLAVRIGHGRVLREDTSDGPVEEVRVVDQRLGVEGVIVEDQGTVVSETASNASQYEVTDPAIGEPAPHVEVLDGELADDGEAEQHAHLRPRRIVRPVEVGLVCGSGDHAEIILREPALEHVDIMDCLGSPLELAFLEGVFRDTETDKFTILNVIGDLSIDSSPDAIIVSILSS